MVSPHLSLEIVLGDFIDSRLYLNLLRCSSSVDCSRSISRCCNLFSRICVPLKGTVSSPFSLNYPRLALIRSCFQEQNLIVGYNLLRE